MASEHDSIRDFRAVYRRHYGFVWHALHRFGTTSAVLDDAVQDVFVTAYRRRADFRGDSPKAWLYGIARRVASNYRRSGQRRRRRDDAVAATIRAPSPDVAREAIETLDRFLHALPARDRELFVLSELEGMTGKELAEVTGRNVQTIYTRVRKLREQLHDQLRELPRVRRERPQATAQGWALLVPALQELALPTAAASATTAATWGWVGAAVGVGALAMVTLRGLGVGDRPTDRPRIAAASAPAIASTSPRNEAHAAPDTPVAAAPPRPEPSPEHRGVATDLPREPVAAAQVPRRSRPAVPTETGPAPETGFAEDLALITRARTQLAEGDAAAALTTTNAHGDRFPDSTLSDLRRALRIEALCGLGRRAQAREEAATFLRTHPGSPIAEKIRTACPQRS